MWSDWSVLSDPGNYSRTVSLWTSSLNLTNQMEAIDEYPSTDT